MEVLLQLSEMAVTNLPVQNMHQLMVESAESYNIRRPELVVSLYEVPVSA